LVNLSDEPVAWRIFMKFGLVAARPRGYLTAPSMVFLLCLRKSVMGANNFCSEQKRHFLGQLAFPVLHWG